MAKADIILRGKAYSVTCVPGQEDRLVQLAGQLDQRIAQIVGAVGEIGQDRLLLVACLALLDELDAAKRDQDHTLDIEKLTHIIADAATRIETLAIRLEDYA